MNTFFLWENISIHTANKTHAIQAGWDKIHITNILDIREGQWTVFSSTEVAKNVVLQLFDTYILRPLSKKPFWYTVQDAVEKLKVKGDSFVRTNDVA